MIDKILSDRFDQTAGEVLVNPAEERTKAERDEAAMLKIIGAEIEQDGKILEKMPSGSLQTLATDSLRSRTFACRRLLSGELDWENFALVWIEGRKTFDQYVALVTFDSSKAAPNELVAAVSTMNPSEEMESLVANLGEGKLIQIGMTTGKPVRVQNVSHGTGIQIGGHMSGAGVRQMLRGFSLNNQGHVLESDRCDTDLKDELTPSASSNVTRIEISSQGADENGEPLKGLPAERPWVLLQSHGKAALLPSNSFANVSHGTGAVQYDVETHDGRFKGGYRLDKAY